MFKHAIGLWLDLVPEAMGINMLLFIPYLFGIPIAFAGSWLIAKGRGNEFVGDWMPNISAPLALVSVGYPVWLIWRWFSEAEIRIDTILIYSLMLLCAIATITGAWSLAKLSGKTTNFEQDLDLLWNHFRNPLRPTPP